ncbi:MAG: general secretion pathway protein GspD [Burkholderiaceae bacterium]|nr:general secretion pathway protein GspD [Burkholderiaceae bacterium]
MTRSSPLSPTLGMLLLGVLALLASCANPALKQADDLARGNQPLQAHALLSTALVQEPGNANLRAAQIRMRERASSQLVLQIDASRTALRWDDAREYLERLTTLEPKHPRLKQLSNEIVRGQKQERLLGEARQLLKANQLGQAEARVREVLIETPGHPGARALAQQLHDRKPLEALNTELAPAFQKPVTLEFREAPLRNVFEALSRSTGINFVFDKDVRGDSKVTIFLRNVTLDEAMRVILSTQQLDRKLLNESSVLIFPNTQGKQREHQELITRTLYLANADVKQVQTLVRTIAKVRDIYIDERLNLMVVRDTPEVMRLVERLIASVDLPEPEVMLEVEVMELATDRVDALGLQWPDSVQFGLPTRDFAGNVNGLATGQVPIGRRNEFRATIANPALLATLRGTSGNVNLLANPKIRVRNKEKAKVQIGEKLPVFTTTTAVNVGTSASVSYLDVGLKLDVEPTIQLDNDVSIKVALEVSNLIRQVQGPAGSIAYQVGTRVTSTTLRLNDGETQILAGLINDEDRHTAAGVPGLSSLPVVGRLFGLQTDTRNKTEVVLLITPRIVRNLALPDSSFTQLAGGTDSAPGAFSSLLRSAGAKAGVGLSSGGSTAQSFAAPVAAAPQAAPANEVVLNFAVTPQVAPGGTLSVTVKQDGGATIRGEVEFDPSLLAPAQAAANTGNGRVPFELGPRGERVVVFRALPAASGQMVAVNIVSVSATGPGGEAPTVRLDGQGLATVGKAP